MRRSSLLLALVVGCAVGPSYQRPEIATPKAFSEGSAGGPKSFERWWTGFRDPMLESLVVRAVQGNLDLKVSSARIPLEVQRRQSALRIGVLLGGDPEARLAELDAPGTLPPAAPELPQVLPSELLSRRPDLRRSERELESLRGSVAANRRGLELATERYTSSLESFLSVLDAQRSVYAAEDQLVQNQRDVAVALIAVYKALGSGWAS